LTHANICSGWRKSLDALPHPISEQPQCNFEDFAKPDEPFSRVAEYDTDIAVLPMFPMYGMTVVLNSLHDHGKIVFIK
jgi:hypothetical protein